MEDRLRRPAQTVRRPGDRRSVGQATDGQEARRQTVRRPGDRRSTVLKQIKNMLDTEGRSRAASAAAGAVGKSRRRNRTNEK